MLPSPSIPDAESTKEHSTLRHALTPQCFFHDLCAPACMDVQKHDALRRSIKKYALSLLNVDELQKHVSPRH